MSGVISSFLRTPTASPTISTTAFGGGVPYHIEPGDGHARHDAVLKETAPSHKSGMSPTPEDPGTEHTKTPFLSPGVGHGTSGHCFNLLVWVEVFHPPNQAEFHGVADPPPGRVPAWTGRSRGQ